MGALKFGINLIVLITVLPFVVLGFLLAFAALKALVSGEFGGFIIFLIIAAISFIVAIGLWAKATVPKKVNG